MHPIFLVFHLPFTNLRDRHIQIPFHVLSIGSGVFTEVKSQVPGMMQNAGVGQGTGSQEIEMFQLLNLQSAILDNSLP